MPYNDIEAIKDILANSQDSGSGDGGSVTPAGSQLVVVTCEQGSNGFELSKTFNELKEILDAGNYCVLKFPTTNYTTGLSMSYGPLNYIDAYINENNPSANEYRAVFLSNANYYLFSGTTADGTLVMEYGD